jgi:DNA-binding XRE family transcriptional regulator
MTHATHPNLTLFCPRCWAQREAAWRRETEEHEISGVRFAVQDTHYSCLTCGEELDDPAVPDSIVPVFAEYRRVARTLLPEQVREIRERAGLSQVAFATLLGMSPATINMYEHGSPIGLKEDCMLRMAALPGAIPMLLRVHGDRLRPRQLPEGWAPGTAPGDPPVKKPKR